MQKRYYLDTCIWRDYFENRKDRFRPLGDWAFEAIKIIIDNEDIIIYSDAVEEELLSAYSKEKVNEIISIVPPEIMIKVCITKKQAEEGRILAKKLKIPLKDAFHSILARDNNAILISRDKHFYNLLNIVVLKLPEELI